LLALLYDVHGNLPALEAVLADARRAGAERYLLGGDYALFGAWPLETLELLETLPARWLSGNGERWTLDATDAPRREPLRSALAACRELLPGERIEALAALPQALALEGTLFCHGSPRSDVESFDVEPAASDGELLAGVRESRVVFGHTHLQFRRRVASAGAAGGVDLVNPGSVGLPFDGDHRAAYGLQDGERIELRRVEYDFAASAAAVRERYDGWAETVARRIELARLVRAPI
jgi:diadenosine tetraphosphatase ApaH/serine/threonine PP2A family protein phosphatase